MHSLQVKIPAVVNANRTLLSLGHGGSQVQENGHVNITGEGRFLAHSFSPNLMVRIDELSSHPIDFVALRRIKVGETLCFNYCSTEWEMAEPFTDSVSGRPTRGFKFLEDHEKVALLKEGMLPAHVLRMWLRTVHGLRAAG